VDSTFYSSVSMLRTIELILGLRPLTQFDASANPLAASFTDTPNFSPYKAAKPQQPLDEMNTPLSPMASESSRMDFSREDRAPQQLLNEAIWKSVKGANNRMPAPPAPPPAGSGGRAPAGPGGPAGSPSPPLYAGARLDSSNTPTVPSRYRRR